MTDPVDRIIDIVFRAQGELTLNELRTPHVQFLVAKKARDDLCNEFVKWFRAKMKLNKLQKKIQSREGPLCLISP